MKRLVILAIALLFAASAPAMACCYLNKDVHNNSGLPAWDIRIVFQGTVTVVWHYDGYPDDWHFQQFSTWQANGRTYLRWFDPVGPDGTKGPIPWCSWVHVGYQLTGPAPILHFWWTDEGGCPLPGGQIQQPSHWVNWSPNFPTRPVLRLVNDARGVPEAFCVPACPDPTIIGNLYYAVLPQETPLDELNAQNPFLESVLTPIDPIPQLPDTLPADGDFIEYEIPVDTEPGQWLVYRLDGFGLNEFVDFGQHQMETASGVEHHGDSPHSLNQLHESSPNPANPRAKIGFSLERSGHVSLRIIDVSGRLVRTLLDEVREAGDSHVIWDGRNDEGQRVSAGTYFYQLEAPGFKSAKKMVILQ